MQPIKKIESRTVVLVNKDIDTDQIIPARFLTTTQREGLGAHAFAEWRFDKNGELRSDFVLNTAAAADCKVLVAGDNFGCGSSREHAPWALLDFGIEAVISTSMADIFRSNALKNGLLPIVVDENTHQFLISHPGIDVTVDVAARELRFDAQVIEFELDDFSQYCLLNGVDELGYLLEQQASIEAWENERS
ncbi:MAG: 3-isopropylmalate dehydratase small subunit [Gammaproteobacteria bacterium]|nr:3-isopropylmalate dehydratase small subunit [Gammaproteobacteria bacterium]